MKKRRKSRARGPIPKGAYHVPTGGYVTKPTGGVTANGRKIYIIGVRREQPDVTALARAFLRIVEDEVKRDSDRAA